MVYRIPNIHENVPAQLGDKPNNFGNDPFYAEIKPHLPTNREIAAHHMARIIAHGLEQGAVIGYDQPQVPEQVVAHEKAGGMD